MLEVGWHDGFTAPVHGPGSYFSLVAIAGTRCDYLTALRKHLHLIAMAAHRLCRELTGASAQGAVCGALAARELECLHWVAAGAFDQTISRQPDLSANSVREDIATALAKFHAATRAQAVAMQMAGGML